MGNTGEEAAAVSETFGEAVRRWRATRGDMSLRELARRAHVDPGHLSRVETGRRPPAPTIAAALDLALDAGGDLVARARPAGSVRWSRDGTWRRPDSEALAGMLLAEAPTAENAVRLAHEWLITDPPQVYEARAGRRIGDATVERVERRVHQLRLLDDHVGGVKTHEIVTAELAATAALLREGSYTERVGRRLLVAVGELCQLAGYVATDAGRYAEAERRYLAGMRAAQAGGDVAGAANNLSTLAYQEANVGDPRRAVTLARSAYCGARHAASATTRALLLERVAWTHARAAEAEPAVRALDAVEEALTRRRPADDPAWVYWLSADETAVMAGRVWTQLRRPLRAVPILERTTAGYGEETGRETSLYLTWLAESLLQAGEVERAAEVAMRAAALARRADSVRAGDRVAALWPLFQPYRGIPAVDQLTEQFRFATPRHSVGGRPPAD
ncbi:Helix-turn-helix domain-containing protein [Micromonospora pattaloongensis]|uniref:Helix-turn-helix domain-containing protein n=1 Tax=Micromonospora pattaloongensis TaxID=405436 RepID=A0A1H3SQ64_9ACTN|nr:helix-turn-helix transcriptional regulator [Micromonospora pattaloongensis]SDZ39860.1 Helix-turn-helix domain-containing protein [Micromonospora pattaloongensis]